MRLLHRACVIFILSACGPLLKSASEAQTPAPAPVNYAAAIADARRAWGKDARELADLLQRLAAASGSAAKIDDELARQRKALADLATERRQALADLRSGAFCTGCGRTRTELLSKGEPFPHPGERSRPATPQEITKAEAAFDLRADQIRKQIARLESELKSAESEVTAAYHRLLALIPTYHDHLAQEQEKRLGRWLDEKTAAETGLKALHAALISARTLEKTNGTAQTRAARERVERQLQDRIAQGRLAEDRARQEERLFRRDTLGSIEYLAGLAKPIPTRYGVNGAFIAATLRTPPKPLGYTVTAIYVGGPSATVGDLQRLLEGTDKSQPPDGKAKPAVNGEKSVRDLLEGK